jgi:outer membrane protein OmpA-like peptidoglycan-associated protein
MKKITAALVIFLSFVASAHAVSLRWDIPKNERLEMTRTASVKFLVNDRTQKIYQERNIIDLTCNAVKGEVSSVKGVFSVYARDSVNEVFQLRTQYPSEFDIDRLGRFTVPKKLFMPNLRNIPTFPEKEVKKGDAWTANADLILDVFSIPFKLTFPVEYQLTDIQKKGDTETAVIGCRFLIDMDLTGGKYPADFPQKILGRDLGTIYWDIRSNRPAGMKEKYRIIFLFSTGTNQKETKEFQMLIDTAVKMYKPVTEEEKEKDKLDLKKDIPDGVDVDTEKRGMVLRLGDVLFDFDSAGLRAESREKLDKIAGILNKKYPDREIIVEGHTDNVGGPDYNQRLSRDRARSVARYLKPKTGLDKLSFRGFGADNPIADNATKEGRQKNRRVEIIIKLQ